ncbi:DNA polymerase II small subunit, partial [Natrinema gari JCM 14663]
MPLEAPARIVGELTSRGYNAEREAVTRLAAAENPTAALERVLEEIPDDALVVRTDHVETALSTGAAGAVETETVAGTEPSPADSTPSVSTGTAPPENLSLIHISD